MTTATSRTRVRRVLTRVAGDQLAWNRALGRRPELVLILGGFIWLEFSPSRPRALPGSNGRHAAMGTLPAGQKPNPMGGCPCKRPAPSPLAGEGWGGGTTPGVRLGASNRWLLAPTPALPREEGRV